MGKVVDFPAFVNLENIKRGTKVTGGVRIRSIEVLERALWKISVGEKLKYKVNVIANRDLTTAKFRSRLFCADGTSVSVLRSPKLISFKKGEEVELTIEADVSQLVPGKYMLATSIYGVNEYGGWEFYDHIDGAVGFEVETVVGFNDNMTWDAHWWGNVTLPDLIATKTTKRIENGDL